MNMSSSLLKILETGINVFKINSQIKRNKVFSGEGIHLYQDYIKFTKSNQIEPVPYADFGKILKSCFPLIKKRRFGSRSMTNGVYVGLKRRNSYLSAGYCKI